MTARRGLTIEVVTSGATRAPGLARWLASIAPARAGGVMTVAIVPDRRVRELNRRYRRKDVATDVLSFPASTGQLATTGRLRHGKPSDEPGFLGDVVIAAGVARRQ